MNNKTLLSAFLLGAGVLGSSTIYAQSPQNNETRVIRLLQDDAQLKISSKVYELCAI